MVDPNTFQLAARVVHSGAFDSPSGVAFIGSSFSDGSQGIVVGVHLEDEAKLAEVLSALRLVLGDAIPDPVTHLAEMHMAEAALGSLGRAGIA